MGQEKRLVKEPIRSDEKGGKGYGRNVGEPQSQNWEGLS